MAVGNYIAKIDKLILLANKTLETADKDRGTPVWVNEELFVQFKTLGLECLKEIFGTKSAFYKEFKMMVVSHTESATYQGRGTLTAAKTSLEETPKSEIGFDVEKMAKSIKEVKERRENQKTFCYYCNGDTKQNLLFEKGEITEPREIIAFDDNGKRKQSAWTIEARIFKILQCAGCEKINLNVYMRHNPAVDDLLIHHFPTKDFRPFPKWVQHLNRDYLELFCEIYLSLNYGSIRLPLMGARTVLDMYIVEKIGDVGSFKQKLQKLVDEKYISNSNRDLLEVALEYGHATIHRGYQPSKEEINGVMDIIENILHSEALTDKTKELKRTIPKKKK